MKADFRQITDSVLKSPISIALVVIIFFFANLISHYPGQTNFDSDLQYTQALSGHFNDWQPPIMARVWSWLHFFADGGGPLFLLQVFFYWLGFGLIAISLSKKADYLAGWAILIISILPPILMMNVQILKDVSLAVSFLLSFAICFWFRSQNKKIRLIAKIIVIILLFYGTLVRANGVFALPPLLIYLLYPQLFSRPVRFFTVCFLIVIVAIPISNIVNHKVLGADDSHPIRQLWLFDIAGITFNSNDVSIFQYNKITLEKISECYNPAIRDALDNQQDCHVSLNPDNNNPIETWGLAIAKHPLAYAKHRLTHFSSELTAVLPRHHAEDSKYNWMIYVDTKPLTLKEKIIDFLRYLPIFRPWFALIIGLIICGLSFSKSEINPYEASFSLVASGLFYMIAYLFIGVASDFRYQYWPMMAIFASLVIHISTRRLRDNHKRQSGEIP